MNLTYPLELSYWTASFNPELGKYIQDFIKRSDKLTYKIKKTMEVDKDEYKCKKYIH